MIQRDTRPANRRRPDGTLAKLPVGEDYPRVPLRHHGESVGSIHLTEKDGGREFTDGDQRTMAMPASFTHRIWWAKSCTGAAAAGPPETDTKNIVEQRHPPQPDWWPIGLRV